MITPSNRSSDRLVNMVGLSSDMRVQARRADDAAWIAVIHRMDEIYSDLVKYQVELENKNSELENAQNFIQSVVSSMSEILIVCSIDGAIQQVNQALEKSLGYSEKSIKGKALTMLFSKEHLTMISNFPEHIRSGGIVECEVDLLDKHNKQVPMVVNCSARYDHEGRLSGLVVTGRPVEELRKAYSELKAAHSKLKDTQTQLIQSEKMASLGRLVAGVAHELNNPISFVYANMFSMTEYQNRIKHYIDAVHQGVSGDQLQELRKKLNIDELMDDIEPLVAGSMEGAERVKEIVKNLQMFATPHQEKERKFELVEVVKRAVSWVVKASPMSIEIVENYPKEVWTTNKEGYIHQILINLIQNAIDAMEGQKKPQMKLTLVVENKRLLVKVADNGHGVNESDQLKIFDPFFTTKPVGDGTGLGLYISYGLATDQCGGDLLVENLKQGGAEFSLSLPYEACE